MSKFLDRLTGREHDRQVRVFRSYCDELDSSTVEMGFIGMQIDPGILSAARDVELPADFGGSLISHPELHSAVEEKALADLTGATAVGETVMSDADRAAFEQYKFFKYLKEAPTDPTIAAAEMTAQGGQLAINTMMQGPIDPTTPVVPVSPAISTFDQTAN